ncbi:hypothetical protein QUF75_13455 [Desulfococcaceae bacterium HSG7]|nr:hypothetical protein [Desulfococcaceae bacterium HSG7]
MNTTQTSDPNALAARKPSFLSDKVIGISISESPDMEQRGLGPMHLNDAMVEFARYLLTGGATLAYGGDLRKDGFTEILFELVKTHNRQGKPPYERIINFLAWPIHLKLTTSQKAELKKVALFKPLNPPDYLDVNKTEYIKPDSIVNRYIWARCLSSMRKEMNQSIQARIILGGKVTKYSGKYPGLAEEALLALQANTPLYLIGGFGGCTYTVIQALLGKQPEELTLASQIAANDAYGDLVDYYNDQIQSLPQEYQDSINYEWLVDFFNQKGIQGLNNGLNEDDNKRLFKTIHIPEIISLVLKGLSKLLTFR